MTPERRIQIEEHDSPLTANELALGWHFCPEFDGMLTSGEPTNRDTPESLLICACGNKINPNTCITYEGEEPHGTRDTFVPPPDKTDEEMTAALNSLTEEDMKPHERPTPAWEKCPQPSEEKTIHYHDHKWWYWDETNMHRHGPYETHAECLAGLKHYCHVYLGHPEDPS